MPWFNWRRPLRPVFLTAPQEVVPVDPDTYVRQLDDEISAAEHAGDLALVDALTAERCRVLLTRGEPS